MSDYTQKAEAAIDNAAKIAKRLKDDYVGSEHLLLALLNDKESVAGAILAKYNITYEAMVDKRKELERSQPTKVGKPEPTPMFLRLLEGAKKEAKTLKAAQIGTEHLLISLLKEKDALPTRLINESPSLSNKIHKDLLKALGIKVDEQLEFGRSKEIEVGGTATLDKFGKDLTLMAKNGKFDPIIGREQEIDRIIQVLSRRTKNNPCLVGEPGVGKTAIVEGICQRIAQDNVPDTVKNMRVVSLDLASMLAGTKYRGEFEERIKKTLAEIIAAENIILFIDELHTIIGAGSSEGTMDASNILKPSLARGELRLIGATTFNEYRKYIEKDSALERRFQPIVVEEPSEQECVRILNGIKPMYERHHQVTISEQAVLSAVQLSKRYVTDRFLPDKAIDVIDESASKVRVLKGKTSGLIKAEEELKEIQDQIEQSLIAGDFERISELKQKQEQQAKKVERFRRRSANDKAGQKTVTEEVVASVISSWTHIPINRLTQKESDKLLKLEKQLHRRVVGQEEAIEAVSRAIRRGRAGIKDPAKPVGSFLFLGPTGVGKTELCKALAEVLFSDQNALIRIDMSEYMEKHSVSKIIGSPPGYVGHEEGGQLSELVRRKPYSVLLFDEIEKAHPDVFNILLQVLDDGHITDSKGRKVDFKNTIIIMTSNVGARSIVAPKRLGFQSEESHAQDYKQMKSKVLEELKRLFKPEFLNRIDETIVFHPLTEAELEKIVEILMHQLKERLNDSKAVKIVIDKKAKQLIVRQGYDKAYGARPLKRRIQSLIEDKLAEKIINGEISDQATIRITAEAGQICLKIKQPKQSNPNQSNRKKS